MEVGSTYNDWVVTLKDAVGETITGTRKLTWESQNPTVAAIDAATGVVTAVASGEAIITVRGEGKFAHSDDQGHQAGALDRRDTGQLRSAADDVAHDHGPAGGSGWRGADQPADPVVQFKSRASRSSARPAS